MIAAMVACTAMVPFGLTNVVTYALSVAAIVITGVVLIQGYRDTAAIHAKLDEIIVALQETRNNVVGLEHAEPEEIKAHLARLEMEAAEADRKAEKDGASAAWAPVAVDGGLVRLGHGIASGKDRSGKPPNRGNFAPHDELAISQRRKSHA
jgi:low affinity Fe/Cu permease